MEFLKGLWPGRETQFESGNAATNSIVLTRRRATVSLTKQGALSGNLRVNLSWRMRTSDIEGRSRQSGRLLRPFKLFQPEASRRTPRAWSTSTWTWAVCTSWRTAPRASCSPWATCSAI